MSRSSIPCLDHEPLERAGENLFFFGKFEPPYAGDVIRRVTTAIAIAGPPLTESP